MANRSTSTCRLCCLVKFPPRKVSYVSEELFYRLPQLRECPHLEIEEERTDRVLAAYAPVQKSISLLRLRPAFFPRPPLAFFEAPLCQTRLSRNLMISRFKSGVAAEKGLALSILESCESSTQAANRAPTTFMRLFAQVRSHLKSSEIPSRFSITTHEKYGVCRANGENDERLHVQPHGMCSDRLS